MTVYYSDFETLRHLLTAAEAQVIEKEWKECDADGIEVGTFIAHKSNIFWCQKCNGSCGQK